MLWSNTFSGSRLRATASGACRSKAEVRYPRFQRQAEGKIRSVKLATVTIGFAKIALRAKTLKVSKNSFASIGPRKNMIDMQLNSSFGGRRTTALYATETISLQNFVTKRERYFSACCSGWAVFLRYRSGLRLAFDFIDGYSGFPGEKRETYVVPRLSKLLLVA